MTGIRGDMAKCWWYNPSDGKAIEIGTYKTSEVHSFTPVSAGDWVLVIDNNSAKLPAPGSEALIKTQKIKK
jgi:hypothetical protein